MATLDTLTINRNLTDAGADPKLADAITVAVRQAPSTTRGRAAGDQARPRRAQDIDGLGHADPDRRDRGRHGCAPADAHVPKLKPPAGAGWPSRGAAEISRRSPGASVGGHARRRRVGVSSHSSTSPRCRRHRQRRPTGDGTALRTTCCEPGDDRRHDVRSARGSMDPEAGRGRGPLETFGRGRPHKRHHGPLSSERNPRGHPLPSRPGPRAGVGTAPEQRAANRDECPPWVQERHLGGSPPVPRAPWIRPAEPLPCISARIWSVTHATMGLAKSWRERTR